MKHYIIVKFNTDGRQRENLALDIEALFQRSQKLSGVRSVSVRRSVIDLPNRYDLMICVEMERDALAAFDRSQIHREWKEQYARYLEAKTIFDCD